MKILIFFSILVFSFSSFSQVNEEKNDHIYWNKTFTLEWTDFQGVPPDTKSSAALSNIAIPYGFETYSDGRVTINVNACFIKSKSWSIPKFQNNLLLQHEQLHFDIAELIRRKIVKALIDADITVDNAEAVMKSIMKHYWAGEYKQLQEQYDAESNFSRFISKQIEWNNKIAEELEKLDAYKYTELTLGLKQD
jgi:signal recognition particle GTPase